ncbi:uncharacterized protein SPSK_06327 [Sporothrix schenckii 1099-18]|uniref:Uncharacterized protein n=1 Tax=Sporothrix schenckii 1099-18 TaxID=1397361 RepID=A0A0F2MPG1_SPOSC|nr:uncharacterized protein SPSK_06327 [Sporothrix schenckii 1099-18]KJR90056.1 hypothetical protein SPSK_06327 [Sporothrix schenckii 1099-18]
MQLLARTSLPPATSVSSDEPVAFQNFVANDTYIVVCLSNATVHVLSSVTGALLQETPFVHPAGYVSRPILDGDTIIMCSPSDVNLTVYSIPQQVVACTLSCPDPKPIFLLTPLHLTKDDCVVAAIHFDGSLCVWDVRTRAHLYTAKLHSDVAFFRTVVGKTLVTSSADWTRVVSNWETGAVLWKRTFGEPYNPRRKGKLLGIAAYAQTACNGKIVAGTTDRRLFVFDLETGHQLAEWQAADSMTQHLLVQGNRLVQLSWGEMKIWSLSDYSLVHRVRMFDRVATSVALSRQSVICCGRDASEDNDRCGLHVGIKDWTFGEEQAIDSGQPDTPETDRSKGCGTDVFNIGPPLRNAGDLQVLSGDRLVLNVLRGSVWSVEIWQL